MDDVTGEVRTYVHPCRMNQHTLFMYNRVEIYTHTCVRILSIISQSMQHKLHLLLGCTYTYVPIYVCIYSTFTFFVRQDISSEYISFMYICMADVVLCVYHCDVL